MIELKGTYTNCKIMTDNIEKQALEQIQNLCNHPKFKGSKIRVMPDVHAGAGCVIGLSAETDNTFAIPNIIGVDISCTVSTYKIKFDDWKNNLSKLDEVIHNNIPAGFKMRNSKSKYLPVEFTEKVKETCIRINDMNHYNTHINSLGTLGGGNHFIELDISKSTGDVYLTIHSGSRNFGHKIAKYYQDKAEQYYERYRKDMVKNIINNTPPAERSSMLDKLKNENAEIDKSLLWIEGEDLQNYIIDMQTAQEFAWLNHHIIFKEIQEQMGWNEPLEIIVSNHNYIEFKENKFIIRKGAVNADKDKLLIIPLNMRDGVLVCKGKGNNDWNNTSPHGAGRSMSRKAAQANISIEEYKASMEGIYSTCINENTLDEAPSAYKPSIEDYISDTVEIIDRLYPVYNFKASE